MDKSFLVLFFKKEPLRFGFQKRTASLRFSKKTGSLWFLKTPSLPLFCVRAISSGTFCLEI
jgi:hypothetical protein